MNIKYNLGTLLKNRHYYVISSHITIKKIINAVKGLFNYYAGASNLNNYPLIMKTETTDVCNLRCPQCHDGSMPRLNAFLDDKLYKRSVNEMKDYLFEVILYHQGEPLLDKNILDYIKYAHENNIGTIISSSLSMNLSEDKIEGIVKSGLDYMIVAIDGMTQETQSKKRIGSKLSKVIFNLNRFIKTKQRLGSKTPFIEWQMIDFAFNKNEQLHAEKFAKDIGVDRFILKPSWDDTLFSNTSSRRKKKCPLLWYSVTMLCDGSINACHNDFPVSITEESLNGRSLTDIWNSPAYKDLRKTHRTNESVTCSHCHLYDRQN